MSKSGPGVALRTRFFCANFDLARTRTGIQAHQVSPMWWTGAERRLLTAASTWGMRGSESQDQLSDENSKLCFHKSMIHSKHILKENRKAMRKEVGLCYMSLVRKQPRIGGRRFSLTRGMDKKMCFIGPTSESIHVWQRSNGITLDTRDSTPFPLRYT